jgi:hypothetical protein
VKPFRYTLISDGPTDANLIPIIDWTLREAGGVLLSHGVHATFKALPKPPADMEDRILNAIELYPCDVLFIHRDAEREPLAHRHIEIRKAVTVAGAKGCVFPTVAVAPVRMSEAWLLFNEHAIRSAAGNPNGTVPLNLPPLSRIEDNANPKRVLLDALMVASEFTGRRLKKFNRSQAFWRVAAFLEDFSSLRQLPAYLVFESAVRRAGQSGWAPGLYCGPLPP